MTKSLDNRPFNLNSGTDEREKRFISQRYGGNYILLVVVLTVYFVLVAAIASPNLNSLEGWILSSLFYVNILIGFRGTSRKLERTALVSLVIVLAYSLNRVAAIDGSQTLVELTRVVGGLLVIILMLALLRDIIRDDRVTIDTIMGSIGAYFLFALFWASLYTAYNIRYPDGFNIPNSSGSVFADLLYFSVVTQTALGYGDIVPIDPVLRQLASLQALFGQLYVAILVAWLVGLAVSHFLEMRAKDSE